MSGAHLATVELAAPNARSILTLLEVLVLHALLVQLILSLLLVLIPVVSALLARQSMTVECVLAALLVLNLLLVACLA